MRVTPTRLREVLLIESQIFTDERGWFKQSYQRKNFDEIGIAADFVQENRSCSLAGVLRGLHYQEPSAQGKLVEVIRGAIFDVAVDIRTGSRSFGQWVGAHITADNHLQVWIPAGFAHGFMALEDSEIIYRCTSYYAPKQEYTLLWSDPDIGIEWPRHETEPILSAKDRAGRRLRDLDILPSCENR